MPTTTEEFKEMLIAFRDQDPNGNGKQDEIPFIGATTGWNTDVETFIMNAFTQFNNVTPYNIVDGKVQAEYVTDGYWEGLKFLNELVEEGLLDTTSFTQDIVQLKQLFENEECAVIGALPAGGPNAFANMTGTRYHDYVVIPPLEGPDGFQLTAYMPDNMMMYECFLTSACENPLAVFKYFDAFYSESVSMRSRYGEPGVDWVVPPEASKNLLARYENTLKEHYRNSLILLIGNLPRSLLLVGINTLVFWLPYFSVELFLRSFIAWLMIGFSLVCYGDMIVLRPIFQQLEKQAQPQGQ